MTKTNFFKQSRLSVLITVLTTLALGCSHTQPQTISRSLAAESSEDWIEALPGDGGEFLNLVEARVMKLKTYEKANEVKLKNFSRRLAKYLAFLMSGSSEIPADGQLETAKINLARNTNIKELLSRLLSSSTQFIDCANPEDYECLERTPLLIPTSKMRVENPDDKLGDVKIINAKLDGNIEWYFTTQFLVPEAKVDFSKTLAAKLENKIRTEGISSIRMAVFGIDDIQKSMKGVYSALIEKINAGVNGQAVGVNVQAVFDQEGLPEDEKEPVVMTYYTPTNPADLSRWILKQTIGEKTNMAFQYNGGTQGLIRALAKNAEVSKNDEDAKGRIEWKDDGIMHNKFFVFDNGGQLSLWTGTANVSETCMGTERNSNMGVFIRNNEIAQTFLDEFNEMYTFQDDQGNPSPEKVRGPNGGLFRYGRFHSAKLPNTHRLFRFNNETETPDDDTDFKVYFSPTDDGEHRAIIPMLHSAKSGDILRISMFGAAGQEYVRALQLAASRDVKIELVLDSPTAFGPGSWIGSTGDATLLQKNPFNQKANIRIKTNARSWKQNHEKIGLLLRKSGTEFIAQQFIVGSQNWSSSGNDKNDENLIVIKNNKGLEIARAFDEHFTKVLWPNSRELDAERP
mgnify:CR=1 FL=1